MKYSKHIIGLSITVSMLFMQLGSALAASASQEGVVSGTITALTCDTDTATGAITFLVTLTLDDGSTRTARIDQQTAVTLGLIYLSEDGSPDCSEEALAESIGWEVSIEEAVIIPDNEEKQHPVGGVLATFFEDITDYETIMSAHEDGFGFGVIAQALWMVRSLNGSDSDFLAILEAKESGDYSALGFEDVENWGQFRKAVLSGENGNLGLINGNGNGNGNGQGNGNQNNNGNHGNGNNGNGNGNNDDNKEKGKDKDK
jgi:hypothetical protein